MCSILMRAGRTGWKEELRLALSYTLIMNFMQLYEVYREFVYLNIKRCTPLTFTPGSRFRRLFYITACVDSHDVSRSWYQLRFVPLKKP